jgi:hypothetical protein
MVRWLTFHELITATKTRAVNQVSQKRQDQDSKEQIDNATRDPQSYWLRQSQDRHAPKERADEAGDNIGRSMKRTDGESTEEQV